jgi:L-asparaginase
MIRILFTGGTISMQRDARAGGNVPAHGGAELVALAPGLDRVAPFEIEDWGKQPACHMGQERLWELRNRVATILREDRPQGIVITHGTDTIEETAYLLARTIERTIPVVVTGAMLTSSDAGWDGPRNLTDAVRVAADPASRDRGAMVVFAGRVLSGLHSTKVQATAPEAFAAPHGAPLGTVGEGGVRYAATPHRVTTLSPDNLRARVALVPMIVGDGGELLDAARERYDGVVVVAFGAGNVPPGAVPAIHRWLGAGKHVVLASRCLYGEVTPVYAFEGGGATLVRAGVIPAGARTPAQARMELVIALSAGTEYGA